MHAGVCDHRQDCFHVMLKIRRNVLAVLGQCNPGLNAEEHVAGCPRLSTGTFGTREAAARFTRRGPSVWVKKSLLVFASAAIDITWCRPLIFVIVSKTYGQSDEECRVV